MIFKMLSIYFFYLMLLLDEKKHFKRKQVCNYVVGTILIFVSFLPCFLRAILILVLFQFCDQQIELLQKKPVEFSDQRIEA